MAFDPVDFIARLAALVPKPRVNLTRYHGVLAPNHRWRGLVTPARRGKGVKFTSNAEVRTPPERHAARACPALSGMTWAQRLKRVFNIDIEVCARCGGSARVIVEASNRCIEDQNVIDRILDHLRQKEQETPTRPLLLPRAWCHRAERRLGQGELMRSIKRGCPGVHCSFSPGRTPAHSQQGSL